MSVFDRFGHDPDEHEVDAAMAEALAKEGLGGAAETDLVVDAEKWPQYVNAYDHNRSYGGPEEGGWWFDTGTLLASIPCYSEEHIEAAKKVLKEAFGPQFERHHDIGSVICEGVLQILVEDEPGKDYPTQRPHYE